MNEYDSDKISDLMQSANFVRSKTLVDVDCIIFNTCHIREKSTEKVYSGIGKIKKLNRYKKKPIFVLAGCIAQAQGEEIFKRTNYVDIIVGPQSYHRLPEQIKNFAERKENFLDTNFELIEKFDTLNNLKSSRKSKISEFLTIQEGCDKFCSFCVVPYTRGAEFSRSFNSIINEAKKLSDNGVREIVLLGQNVSAYKFIDGNKIYKLANLLDEISKINSIYRIRFTTSHPNDADQELIEAFKYQKKLMPQFHLPIQSGSNKILKLMNRKHTREYYLDLISRFKEVNSEIEFSSDFIIGFPGEEEKDFQDTLDIIKRVKFINSYSFIYSQRPGTPAVDRDQISLHICKDRLMKLQTLLGDIQVNNSKKLIGKKVEVLAENKTKTLGQFFGRSRFMHSVFFNSKNSNPGDLVYIEITSCNSKNLFGILQKEEALVK
jgi:tRNA-2-methylthio-N6-dimethylallyladenosine synthase